MSDEGTVIVTFELTGKGAQLFEELRGLTGANDYDEVIKLSLDTLWKLVKHQIDGGIIHFDRNDSLERRRLVSLTDRDEWMETPKSKLRLVK